MRYLPVLALILFLGCLSAEESPQPENTADVPPVRDQAQFLQNPFEVTDTFIEDGRTIYMKYCVGCHGENGEEPFYHSIKHHAKGHTYGDYVWIVTYGLENTRMPSFKEKLTLEERWKAVAYLKKRLAWSIEDLEARQSLSSLDLSIYDLEQFFGGKSSLSMEKKKELWSDYAGKKVTWKGQVNRIFVDEGGVVKVKIRHLPDTADHDVLLVFDAEDGEKVLKIVEGQYVTYTGILKTMRHDGSPYVLEGIAIEGAQITSD
jgi:hypothetical protein